MSFRSRTLFVALVASCGSGVHGQVPRCQRTAPRGSANGSIDGHALGPIQSACARTAGDAYVISLSGGTATCDAPTGDTLGLEFCEPPAVGDYSVTTGPPLQCPSDPTAEATIAGMFHNGPVTGSIAITDDEPDCLAGTFDLSFSESEAITGEFEAPKL
jgi:hypothetical protein